MAEGSRSNSSASYYSNDSYGSRLGLLKEKKKDRVSSWSLIDLNEKNIFYNDEASSLAEFEQFVKTKVCARRGTSFKCPELIPELHKNLIKFTKDALFFTYDQRMVEDDLVALDEAWSNLEEFDKYCRSLIDQHKSLDHDIKKSDMDNFAPLIKQIPSILAHRQWLLNSWCIATETFLKCYKLFLSTKISNEKESRWEGQFQELLMNFTRIFFMTPEIGQARKRELEINKIKVASVPDIHYIKDVSTRQDIRTLLVLCVEVKPDAFRECGLLTGNFRANEMISSNVLGQHGGELLLEKSYSAFKPKVLGMICLRSQIIFTFMDMKQSHYDCIVDKGQVTDASLKCKIYYTKPYDYLKKSDRDQILDLLFWIGYVQTIDINQ